MTRRAMVVGIAASAVLLAGCAPTLPPPITQTELAALLEQRSIDYWESEFPNEPRPIVEPLGYVDSYGPTSPYTTCLLESEVDGVSLDGGNITFAGADFSDFSRAAYVCSLRYPSRMENPEAAGLLTPAQFDYLYDFFTQRLQPCMRLLGYEVGPVPDRETFAEGILDGPLWNPYDEVRPHPASRADWQEILTQCPRPPYLAEYYWPVH